MPAERQLIEQLFDTLFPIARSITGAGLRQSLGILGEHIPLIREQVPSGTRVFDWTVPQEWQIDRATLTAPDGQIIADFSEHNLHVVNYSEPVDQRLSLEQLLPHLHSLPELPEAIPYVTSYYKRRWGFCLPHKTLESLPEGEYHARIDSRFVEGGVDFGHTLLTGESEREILLSSYLCHPSMANNELSGPLVLLGLYHRLQQWPRRRFSYRFVLNPETIGSLCFLHRYHEHLETHLEAGMVLTCLGGPAQTLNYKMSRRGDGLFDRLFTHLAEHDAGITVRPFSPLTGSDERQYCSPGFNFAVGNIVRTGYAEYPGYHNSHDDKDFMDIDSLVESIDRLERWLWLAETAGTFQNRAPFGEPHLSKYDLYPSMNHSKSRRHSSDSRQDDRQRLNLILHTLSHCDGEQDMVALAERLGLPLDAFNAVIEVLEQNGLLTHIHRRG